MEKRQFNEDVVLDYFYQLFLKDGDPEAKVVAEVSQDPRLFYALWQSFLNYEVITGIRAKDVSLVKQFGQKIALSWYPAKQALSFLGGALLPVGVLPLPALRSTTNEPLYQKGEFLLKSRLLPTVNFLLTVKAVMHGVELELSSKNKLPSWLVVKLNEGDKFRELQNFSQKTCRFFLSNPRGRWILYLADADNKKVHSLVEIEFKK